MTPCEKLGYKVGDKFEMRCSSYGFKEGQVVTLFEDDRTDTPCFKGDNTVYDNAGGKPGAYINLSNVKPVSQCTTKPIGKSKRQMAQLLIEAGVTQFPEGANWAAQDRCHGRFSRNCGFYRARPVKPSAGCSSWSTAKDDYNGIVGEWVEVDTLTPNWHQTVLSRAEFDQIVAETVVPDSDGWIEHDGLVIPVDPDSYVEVKYRDGNIGKQWRAKFYHWIHAGNYHSEDIVAYRTHKSDLAKSTAIGDGETNLAVKDELEALEFTPSQTLDQLLQDWRNADEAAQRKRTEADEAAAMRDERWQMVQARAGEMGVTVGLRRDGDI